MDGRDATKAGNEGLPESPSKRRLLAAGWAAPVVVVLALPQTSYARNTSRPARCPPGNGPPGGFPPGSPFANC